MLETDSAESTGRKVTQLPVLDITDVSGVASSTATRSAIWGRGTAAISCSFASKRVRTALHREYCVA